MAAASHTKLRNAPSRAHRATSPSRGGAAPGCYYLDRAAAWPKATNAPYRISIEDLHKERETAKSAGAAEDAVKTEDASAAASEIASRFAWVSMRRRSCVCANAWRAIGAHDRTHFGQEEPKAIAGSPS